MNDIINFFNQNQTIIIAFLMIFMTCFCSLFFSFRKYRIHFETNGADKIEDIKVRTGKLIVLPKEPIVEGKKFVGWYLDEKLEKRLVLSQMPVRSKMVLYAKYEIIDEKKSKKKK